jgi:predicted DNA-binding transcriptional regulator YafY
MPKDIFISRYALIIKRLDRGRATFKELTKYLEQESEIQDKNFHISQRTLQRDIQHIHSQLQIKIANEMTGEKRYYIKSKPAIEEHGERLLESYQILSTINAAQDYAQYVFLESRQPKGLEHFSGLLYAIKNRRILQFSHYKYEDQILTRRTVHPLALKESQGCWYLIAVDTNNNKVKTFGLDRMQDIAIRKTIFKNSYPYDIKALFKDSFGVINDENEKPQRIRLSFDIDQAQYVQSYPLHHSQETIEESDEEVVFELYMKISHDFEMKLLSYGEEVKVISPATLREAMQRHYENALKRANSTSLK